MAIHVDIDIWRGNSLPPTAWAWPDNYPGTADCQLSVWIGTDLLMLVESGAGLVIDRFERRFVWERTAAQSHLIPLGRIARYELEDRVGGETTIFYGTVVGLGGLNLDSGTTDPGGRLDFSYATNSGQELDGWI